MDQLLVVLSADQYGEERAIAEIWAGDLGPILVEVAADGQAQAQAFQLSGAIPIGCLLTVFFKNDAYDASVPGKDRNIYLLGASLNGIWHAPPPAGKISKTNGQSQIQLGQTLVQKPVILAPLAVPYFADDFLKIDPKRWISFDGKQWPPDRAAAGNWARMYYFGWPTNGQGQDLAARQNTANYEAQVYEDDNVVIAQDGLQLVAKRKPSRGMQWTSGCLVQARGLALEYGYFEADLTLPDQMLGMWPGFWLEGAALKWNPSSGPEIDVLEAVGKGQDGRMDALAYRSGVVGGIGVWGEMLPGRNRWGMLWTPDAISFTLNGLQVGTDQPNRFCKEPMYMVLDLAVGSLGSWPGVPSPAQTQEIMTVHRVASYLPGSWGGAKYPRTA